MSLQTGGIEVDEDLANNPDYLAFQRALQGGAFGKMPPETWVVFSGGKLVGSGMDRGALFRDLDEKGLSGGFVHQVGVSDRVVEMGGPRVARRT
jgi:hypothetical protein